MFEFKVLPAISVPRTLRASLGHVLGRNGKSERLSINPVIADNVEALTELRRRQEEQRTWSQRVADVIARFVGSMFFVGFQALFVAVWLLINTGAISGVVAFDPFPFTFLTLIVSVETIFLTTFILMTQNRMGEMASKRADLDVQVNLLSEHEVTRLIELVDAIALHLDVPLKRPADLERLKEQTSATEVIEKIEEEASKKGIRKLG